MKSRSSGHCIRLCQVFCIHWWKTLSIVWDLCNVFVKMAASSLCICLSLIQQWQSRSLSVLSYLWFLCGVLCHSLYMLVPSGLTSLLHPQKWLQIIMMTKPREFFALFWKWLFCVAWGCFPPISRVTWQPFASLLPSDPYQTRASGSSFEMGAAPFHHPFWPSTGRAEATAHAMDSWPLLW